MSQDMQLRAELQRSFRVQDFAAPGVIMRERSFVRPPSHLAHHNQIREHQKRRSMILTNSRGKPSLEIYRPPEEKAVGSMLRGIVKQSLLCEPTPPHADRSVAIPLPPPPARSSIGKAPESAASGSELTRSADEKGVRADGAPLGNGGPTALQQQQNKLNVHAKEFTMARPSINSPRTAMPLGYGGAALQHSRSSGAVLHAGQALPQHFRPAQPHPLLSSASSGNVLHAQAQNGPRVHFKLPQQAAPEKKLANGTGRMQRPASFIGGAPPTQPGLQRSKSLTSADAIATGMAALGLAADAGDLGHFPPEVQECIDRALEDPNAVSARTLMDAVRHLVGRAVESPRYALPAARRCLVAVEREDSETFLESLLNTCRQWYHDRDKLLSAVVSGGRPRLMAFLSFLLEMYCQLRRRAIHRGGGGAGGGGGAAPGLVLLTLICKCCEDCIRQPVPSPSDTENLFFVLTYIGRDLETQLPAELERLLSAVRDTFLNAAAAPSIRKTLLQLIELHASRWQLPGCAVLYYYPSSK